MAFTNYAQVKSKCSICLQKPFKMPFKWLLQADTMLGLHFHTAYTYKSHLKGTFPLTGFCKTFIPSILMASGSHSLKKGGTLNLIK